MYKKSSKSSVVAAEETRPRYLGEVVRSVAGEHSDWHSHGFGQLISARSGSLYIGTSKRVLLLSPAMALWIPPNATHWMRSGANNEMLYVDVNKTEAMALGSRCRVMAMTPLMSALMAATLPAPTRHRQPGYDRALHDLLRHEIISADDVPLSIVMPEDKRIRFLAQKALDDPGAILSISAWLGEAPASRKTVERLFAGETGMTPSRWLRHARLLHAVILLAAGEKVSTVALDMGYETSSAFSYMFRRTLGMNPRNFSP